MSILSATGLSKAFGVQEIFEDVSFHVEKGDKIGLVGVNGAGKTTLFRLIEGSLSPDSGQMYLAKDTKVAYMEQNAELHSRDTVWEEAVSVFSDLKSLERRVTELSDAMAKSADMDDIRRFHDLQERFIQQGGLTYQSRTRATLLGLGFREEELRAPMDQLSGGQRTRVLLAKLLLGEPGLLLLDEPTNHLDLDAVEWLEGFLSSYSGTVMAISHDRYFLDRFVNRMFEMENGKLRQYQGNFSQYMEKKRALRAAEEKEYQLKTKEIRRIEGIIEQQKRWNRQRNLVTARSKQKSIDRITEGLKKPEQTPLKINFALEAQEVSGNDVLEATGVTKSFQGKILFEHANLSIKRGEKVFLLGANGCGKTTLFRILLKKLAADCGEINIGSNVKIGYYDQTQSSFRLEDTVLEAVQAVHGNLDNGVLRNALAAFLFRGDDIDKKVGQLSGGERARIALVNLMLSRCNFMLLDEPTNHLDINSKAMLEDALGEYNGTLFIISHDRYFINKLADRIYYMSAQGLEEFDGDYQYYLERRKSEPQMPKIEEREKPAKTAYLQKKESEAQERRLKGKISRLELKIEQIEEALNGQRQLLELPENAADYEKILTITQQIQSFEDELAALYQDWESANLELSNVK